jgi:hypothetical protein
MTIHINIHIHINIIEAYHESPKNEKKMFTISLHDIPENFDGRTAFPKCAKIIGHVR